MDICIDFDGTCVTHEFPKVGKDIGAAPVLKELVKNGHRLILFTMRSNVTDNTGYSVEVPEVLNGNFLDDAVNWFKENEIPLYGIQSNPTQTTWTTSPKAYGQLYIDDAALGCPLLAEFDVSDIGDKGIETNVLKCPNGVSGLIVNRPWVDWKEVRKILIRDGIINPHI